MRRQRVGDRGQRPPRAKQAKHAAVVLKCVCEFVHRGAREDRRERAIQHIAVEVA